MEMTTKELGAIEKIAGDKSSEQLTELVELELSLIGGGMGDVAFG